MSLESHEHGEGKNRRFAWGAKEGCEQCMRKKALLDEDALMAEARKDWAERFQPIIDAKRAEEAACETST